MGRGYLDMIYPEVSEISTFQHELSISPPVLATDKVTQLGLSPHLYQNASYERRKHLIGTSILVSMFANQLNLSENDKQTLEAAAMLHDIGHLPFSHAAEDFFKRGGLVQEPESVRIMHESDEIRNILERYEINMEKVGWIIDKPEGGEHNFFHQLISGDLDCDRLDYLRRDSRFTASYGDGIRLTRLLSHVQLDQEKIVYEEGAITEIEHFFAIYRAMYQAVYHNRNTRAFETMLSRALEYKVEATNGRISVEHIASLSESQIETILKEGGNSKKDQVAKELAYLIFDKKEAYKDVLVIRKNDIQKYKDLKEMFPEEEGDCINEKDVEKYLQSNLGLDKGEVFVKTEPLPLRQKPKTDIYIQQVFGAPGNPIMKFENLRDPGETKRKNLHPYIFRVLMPNEQKYRALQPKIIKVLDIKLWL